MKTNNSKNSPNKEATVELKIEDAAYIAGLFDGEGCINCSWGSKEQYRIKQKKHVIRHFPQLSLIITNKNNLLLEMVKAKIGFGNCYRQSGRGVYCYRLSKREEILSLVNVLMPYVKLKNNDLETAKEALLYHLDRRHNAWTKEQKIFFYENYMAKLEKLRPQGKKRGRPPKYTLSDRLV